MKTSLSSTGRRRRRLTTSGFKHVAVAAVLVLFLLTLSLSAAAGETSPAMESGTLPRKLYYYPMTHHHYRYRTHRPCDSFSHEKPRSLCIQFHGNRRHSGYVPPPPPPPSPSQLGKIDPRYGVEKRLVPSGPNPLHN